MVGAPALGIALLIGIVSLVLRLRSLAILCGVFCLLVGGFFFWSLNMAIAADWMLTVFFGAGSLLAGVALILFKRGSKT